MNNSYNERSMKIIDLKKTILEDNDVDADSCLLYTSDAADE